MIIKITLGSLKPGMHVVNPGLHPAEHPEVHLEEMTVPDEATIEAIRQRHCTDVFIDTEHGPYFAANPDEKRRIETLFAALDNATPEEQLASPGFDALTRDIEVLDGAYRDMIRHCRQFVESIKRGAMVEMEASENFVETIIRDGAEKARALFLLSKLRDFDEYTYTHSLNVSLLATLFGKVLGLSHQNLMVLGLAGLYHDVGMLRVPERVMRKSGRLSAQELAELRLHPLHGLAILEKNGKMPPEALRAVAEHHERHDGRGYPRGLAGGQLHGASQTLAIVNTFDSLTSDRRQGLSVHQHRAMCLVFASRGTSFYPPLVDRFVQFFGIYPVGSIVRFANGRKAIVVEQNAGNLLRPQVRVILDAANRHMQPQDLDLAALPPEDAGHRIVDCLSNQECRVAVNAHLKEYRREKGLPG